MALGLDAPPPWAKDRMFSAEPPVQWLSPIELARSASRVAISSMFGSYDDRREEMAHAEGQGTYREPHAHWVDYVADVGDSFDATYAVAEAMARGDLEFGGTSLPRGQTLVMGGDEIYPYPESRASDSSYHERVIGPYESALSTFVNNTEPSRGLSVYAIPGNHDWYDGLSAFRKQFMAGRWLGGRRTRQHASYFALKLPGRWWLWGVDTAFGGPIDSPQLAYFQRAGEEVLSTDGIILCTAEPRWYDADPDGGTAQNGQAHHDPYQLIRFFIAKTLGDHRPENDKTNCVRLMISGDKHHYVRYTERFEDDAPSESPQPDRDRRVKITAGGGGAYLLLTHGLPRTVTLREPRCSDRDKTDASLATTFSSRATNEGQPDREGLVSGVLGDERVWPSRKRSRWVLPLKALWGIWRPATFSAMVSTVYFAMAWVLRSALSETNSPLASDRLAAEAIRYSAKGDLVDIAGAVVDDGTRSLTTWVVMVILAGLGLALAQSGRPLRQATRFRWLSAAGSISLGIAHAGLVGLVTVVVTAASFSLAVDYTDQVVVLAFGLLLVLSLAALIRVLRRPDVWPIVTAAVALSSLFGLLIVTAGVGDADAEVSLAYVLLSLVLGALLGPFAFGLYLVVAALAGSNINDVSVACGYTRYRNFLRMHVEDDKVTVYAVGLQKSPRMAAKFATSNDEDGHLQMQEGAPDPVLLDVVTVRTPRSRSETG